MKRRSIEPDSSPQNEVDNLCRALLSLDTLPAMRAFLRDLCTPAELEALTDRWRVVPLLIQGVPYRDIHEQSAVSITTIGRVARCLNEGSGGYRKAMDASSSRKRTRPAVGEKA